MRNLKKTDGGKFDSDSLTFNAKLSAFELERFAKDPEGHINRFKERFSIEENVNLMGPGEDGVAMYYWHKI